MTFEETKELLETLHNRFNSTSFIDEDPISVPHRFTRQEDIEIAGFLAATIAWGNRKSIVRNGLRIMELLDRAPCDYIINHTEGDLLQLSGFVHRTFNSIDLTGFIRSLQSLYLNHGGLGGFFQESYKLHGDIRIVLSEFRKTFFCGLHHSRTEKHLSSIEKGASCKRLNMFLRWMVRKDDRGVDFGLWNEIPTSALYLPLDVHSGNVGRSLGILERKQNDWKAVEEITGRLREFSREDPVKYDFALFGAGVSKNH